MEVAEDSAQVAKLLLPLNLSITREGSCSWYYELRPCGFGILFLLNLGALLFVKMRSDSALLTLEDGGSPIPNPSTAAEDARLASLISLDGILKQVKDIIRQSSVNKLSRSKNKALLESLIVSSHWNSYPLAFVNLATTAQSVAEEDNHFQSATDHQPSLDRGSSAETDVSQWNVLQFNTGSTVPFIIKCGAPSNLELVIKAGADSQQPKGDRTRARYSWLYRTLAVKVPALRDLVSELEKGGMLEDVKS
ncbi:hypothetical protein Cgig2_029160 [Carnegiea gigantea]|uniref:Uncharacterized protein n=1 Tax=Carnegiea gigantea TaxID=171969 RepID=A0A9Q1KLI7_9CARY|nr:hypothetical protein Cgig2_029160 [Carnegiea gigantea]